MRRALILISEQRAEHLFAGRNTQTVFYLVQLLVLKSQGNDFGLNLIQQKRRAEILACLGPVLTCPLQLLCPCQTAVSYPKRKEDQGLLLRH